jgi:hypothetical protein
LLASAFLQTKVTLVQFRRVESIVGGVLLLRRPTSIPVVASFRSFNLLTSSQNVDELGLRIAVILLVFGELEAIPDTRCLHTGSVLELGVLLVNDS